MWIIIVVICNISGDTILLLCYIGIYSDHIVLCADETT